MANRRMFSKTITNSSQFLMMPQSSQNLYFHLGMNADDDGFCEHFTIMRMTESKPDDLKVLNAKGFIKVFDDKVLVIVDWKENNYLRSDRYTPSKYLEIYKEELKELSIGIPNVNQLVDRRDTQDRLGKDRLGKDKENTTENSESFNKFWTNYPNKKGKRIAEKIWDKLKPDKSLIEKIISSVLEHIEFDEQWKKDDGRFIPHPATFLNQGRWEDEIKRPAPAIIHKYK